MGVDIVLIYDVFIMLVVVLSLWVLPVAHLEHQKGPLSF